MIPAPVREEVRAALGPILSADPVTGGCVSRAARLLLASGATVFLKFDPDAPSGLFEAEAGGLAWLRNRGAGPVLPSVLGAGERWLALEWLPVARWTPTAWEALGRGLATLHRAGSEPWGWYRDGFIGTLPQPNAPAGGWAEFWVARRLEPQLERARARGFFRDDRAAWAGLFRLLPDLLEAAEAEGPATLHGDLWSGNVLPLEGERAALIDPAPYRGHREVDLAMADLFGGFDARFREAYREAWPLAPGADERKLAYQLYYLLVHVNLFGSSYVDGTRRALARLGTSPSHRA